MDLPEMREAESDEPVSLQQMRHIASRIHFLTLKRSNLNQP